MDRLSTTKNKMIVLIFTSMKKKKLKFYFQWTKEKKATWELVSFFLQIKAPGGPPADVRVEAAESRALKISWKVKEK